jgi:hypothetical protein
MLCGVLGGLAKLICLGAMTLYVAHVVNNQMFYIVHLIYILKATI